MHVFKALDAASHWGERCRIAGLSLGCVPTMGALHEGHLSLVRAARRECDRVLVTIFVNPTQFGPGEDFDAYPRTLESDLAACREAGVDAVFAGLAADMYPEGFQTWVTVENVTQPLCGVSRPRHFRGVATVVTQLLVSLGPHRAYFGQKDYQQTLVVRRMTSDLHLPTTIRVCETVRESDGLALSSRNQYLSATARRRAPEIYTALRAVRQRIESGERNVENIRDVLHGTLPHGDGVRLDYAEVLAADSLEPFASGTLEPGNVLVAVALFFGDTRLIDNVLA